MKGVAQKQDVIVPFLFTDLCSWFADENDSFFTLT